MTASASAEPSVVTEAPEPAAEAAAQPAARHAAAEAVPAPADRRNSFDLLRLLFAVCVIFSHAFALAGHVEPTAWGRTLGNLGVHGFFAISGYLIAGSWERSPSIARFSVNRALRILPGLVVATLVATLAGRAFGGYVTNPVPHIINGPVWTLTWEVAAYAALALLGIAGVLRSSAFPAFAGAAWVVYLASSGATDDFTLAVVPMLLMFLGGALVHVRPEVLRTDVVVLAALGLALSASPQVYAVVAAWVMRFVPFLFAPAVHPDTVRVVVYLLSFPIVVVALGRARTRLVLRHDISYGTYLYGWPVAQVVVALAARRDTVPTPWMLFLLTLVGTLPLAYVSWRLVERPALRLKRAAFRRPVRTSPGEPSGPPTGA